MHKADKNKHALLTRLDFHNKYLNSTAQYTVYEMIHLNVFHKKYSNELIHTIL